MNKSMEVSQKQILRGRILSICEQATPIGAGAEVVAGILVKEGYYKNTDDAKDDVAAAYCYLSGKGLIEVETVDNAVLGISRSIARITPEGNDVLDGVKPIDGVAL